GLVGPLLTILVFLALRRDFTFLKTVHLFSAAAAFLLVAGSWYALAFRQGGSAFFVRQIVEESFGTAGGNYGHHQPFYYFIPVFFLNLAPWSFFSPLIAFFLYRRRRELSRNHLLFPIVWLVSVLLFFSLASGKRGVYILPLYPAFALLFGVWWENLDKEEVVAGRRVVSSASYLLAAFTLVAVSRIVFVLLTSSDVRNQRLFPLIKNPRAFAANVAIFLTPPSISVWICLMLFAAAGLIVLFSLARKKWEGVLVGLALIAMASSVFLKTVYYPAIAAQRSMKSFGMRLRQNASTQTPLAFYHAFDYGTIFYSRRHIPDQPQKRNEPNSPLFLLMWEEEWQRLREHNDLEMVDLSEGRGPVDKHRLVLVKSSTFIPVSDANRGELRRRNDTEED
ncbi:MAG: hypothetical protein ACREO5_11315, partial [Candidatus Binatia bacterium]